MQVKIFKYNEINLDNINYSKPIDASLASSNEYKKGYHIIYVSYKYETNNVPLLIEIPSLQLTDQYNEVKKELLLPLSAKDNKHNKPLHDFFSELDKKFIKEITKILKLNKTISNKINSMSYNAVLKVSDESDESYKNGVIQLKLSDNTDVYNANKEKLSSDKYSTYMNKESYVGSIIEITSILISQEQIMITIKPHQLRVTLAIPKSVTLTEYSFGFDSECSNKPDCSEDSEKSSEQSEYEMSNEYSD